MQAKEKKIKYLTDLQIYQGPAMPLAVFQRKWTYRKRIFSYEKEIKVEISPGVQL